MFVTDLGVSWGGRWFGLGRVVGLIEPNGRPVCVGCGELFAGFDEIEPETVRALVGDSVPVADWICSGCGVHLLSVL